MIAFTWIAALFLWCAWAFSFTGDHPGRVVTLAISLTLVAIAMSIIEWGIEENERKHP